MKVLIIICDLCGARASEDFDGWTELRFEDPPLRMDICPECTKRVAERIKEMRRDRDGV